MTRVTDRLSDASIVQLAKQNYETQKKSLVPTYTVKLTSNGLVYPKNHLLRKGYVNMQHMTAYHEDILTNETYIRDGIEYDMLLAELITDDINIDDIALCDYDNLLIQAKIQSYGASYPVTVFDTILGKNVERELDLTTLTTNEITLNPDDNGEFTFTFDDNIIKYKYLTVGGNIEMKKNPDTMVTAFLHNIITEINGSRSKYEIEEFLKFNFIGKHVRAFREQYRNSEPTINRTIFFESEAGGTFESGFQLRPDFFWI